LTRTQYQSKVKRALMKGGNFPVKAVYDYAGNCVICGECGRCHGWHTIDETIKAKERGWIK
jgi:hypothetical protein